MPRVRRIVTLLIGLLVLVGNLPGATPLLEAPIAHAQVAAGGSFGSAIPCLEAPDQFVTSCFANTLVDNSSIAPVASSDTALVRFTIGGKTPLANLGQIGSVYGMAYDDGNVTGVRRLFLGAFARRMTKFGPAGAGAIYEYNLATGAIRTFASVPGTTNRHRAGDADDSDVAAWVGKSGLGDLEMGPSGYLLYAMNLDTRQVDRYDTRTGAQLAPLAIDFAALTPDLAAQADLRPFGLEFQPTNGTNAPMLLIGVIDSGERSPGTITPTAYVVGITPATGVQTTVLTQPLGAAAIAPRFGDGANAGHPAWHAWTATGNGALWPMPVLADIQFSRDGQTMLLGLRDRNGDVYRPDNGDSWWRVQEQGDLLVYKQQSGSWQLQTRGGINTPSDFFGDNFLGAGAQTTAAHVENFMGALAWTLAGTPGSYTEQIVGTAITPLTGGTSGANWYDLAPDSPTRQAAVELIPQGDLWKSATLGDLENLCAVAFIGDRVWRDLDADGVQDAGEPGVVGVLLNLIDPSTGDVLAQATTANDGSYLFAVQPQSDYTIEVAGSNFGAGGVLSGFALSPQNRGNNDATDSDADQLLRRITISPQFRDANNMTFDIGVMLWSQANGIIGNLVWNDNGNGVQEAGELGIPNVTVRLRNTATNAIEQTDTTNSAGVYQFLNIPPGTYQVEFAPPAGVNAAPRDAGGNDATDSDADASSGWRSAPFTVIADTVNTTIDLGLLMSANVRVQKSGPASVIAGGQLTYTIGYANAGPAAAQNVIITDTLPSGLSYLSASPAPSSVNGSIITWRLGALANGAGGSIALTAQASPGLANGAPLANQALISTSSPGDTPGDNTSTTTTTTQRADLALAKSSPTSFPVISGRQVMYYLDFTNLGPAPATNVVLTDTVPAQLIGVAWRCSSGCSASGAGSSVSIGLGTLAAGAGGRVEVTATAQTSLAREDFTNTAMIGSSTPEISTANNRSSTPGAVWTSDVQLVKLAAPQVFAGAAFTTTLRYRNSGPAPAGGVVLTDTLPAGVSMISASPAPDTIAGPMLTWALGTLADQAAGSIELLLRADPALADGLLITNTAQIGTSTPDRTPANNHSTAATLVQTSADLALTKAGPVSTRAGSVLEYTLSYRNAGPSVARAVVLTDTLPAQLTLLDASPAPGAGGNGTLVWQLGDLAPGAVGSVRVRAQSSAAQSLAEQIVTNRAQITSSTPDPQPADNHSASSSALQLPDLAIVKSSGGQAQPGELLTYTLTVRNSGPISATDVVLTEWPPVPIADPAWLAAGDGSYSLALGPLAAGATVTRSVSVYLPNPLPPALLTQVVNTASVRDRCCADPTPDDTTSTVVDTPLAGRVGDQIWLDRDGDGRADTGEPGLAYAPLELLDATTGRVLASGSSDAQGSYRFAGLRLGRYAVRIAPQALATTYRDYVITTAPIPAATLSLAAPRDDTLDIGLQPSATTAVVLAYLLHEPIAPRGYLVRWGTLAERDTQLFRVERSSGRDRIGAVIVGYVPSQGSRGGDYRLIDPTAPAKGPVYYWLVEVETGEQEQVYGPAMPTLQAARFVGYIPAARR